MKITLQELAEMLASPVPAEGAATIITGFASLLEARPGDLSFFSDKRYLQRLAETHASVVLIPPDWTRLPAGVLGLAVANPSDSFEKIVDRYGFHPTPMVRGVHPTAVVAEGVLADATKVAIGAHAVIESGAQIGEDVEIGAGSYVGHGVIVGPGTKLHANVTVQEGCTLGKNVTLHSGCVIGADGFGYQFVRGRHRKIRQAGIVQIDDDVEIGAGSTIDRARFGRTWIGEGTKIDNLVQIGHNVVLGKHCIVVAGTGIAGSAHLGDYVVIAAQSGVAGHVVIGAQCTIAARGGVTKDLPPGPAQYMGFPAAPAAEEKRRLAATRRLPDLLARVKRLEALHGVKEEPEPATGE